MSEKAKLSSMQDLVGAIEGAKGRDGQLVWWRGQQRRCDCRNGRQTEWKLLPKLYRTKKYLEETKGQLPAETSDQNRHAASETERRIAAEFLAHIRPRYSDCPAAEDYPAWLFLMQHYGVPTRLLDWSLSPLVATYFAVECESPTASSRADEETDGVLWALKPRLLNKQQIGVKNIMDPYREQHRDYCRAPFVEDAKAKPRIVAVLPTEVDFRMLVQNSAFTLHSTPKPLESLDSPDDFLVKFTIPGDTKKGFRNWLGHLGITRSYLFPDAQNLGRDISEEVGSPAG